MTAVHNLDVALDAVSKPVNLSLSIPKLDCHRSLVYCFTVTTTKRGIYGFRGGNGKIVWFVQESTPWSF